MASSSDTKRRKRPKSSSSHTLFPAEPSLINSLPSSKADLFRLIAVVSVAAAVAVASNFIAASLNQPSKPFCDSTISDSDDFLSGKFSFHSFNIASNMCAIFLDKLSNEVNQPSKPFCDSTISDSDDFLSDYCEPCPTNGVCYDGKLECAYGYRKHGKLCVEDGDVNKAAKKLSKWVEVRVCEACAQLLCSGIGQCWVSENELLNNLDRDKISDTGKLDEAIYTAAKQKTKETIHSVLETRDNHGIEEIKCPELLVNHYKPLNCVVRQWIIKHALLAVSACGLIIGSILIVSRAYQRHCLSVRAEQLYHEVCDILEEKSLVSRSIGGEGEPWVVASWLRDHLLSPKERKDPFLWRKVEELVQEDSRVDQYPKLVKGESKVVLEWQVEGSLGSSGKRKISDGSASVKESKNLSSYGHRRMHAA